MPVYSYDLCDMIRMTHVHERWPRRGARETRLEGPTMQRRVQATGPRQRSSSCAGGLLVVASAKLRLMPSRSGVVNIAKVWQFWRNAGARRQMISIRCCLTHSIQVSAGFPNGAWAGYSARGREFTASSAACRADLPVSSSHTSADKHRQRESRISGILNSMSSIPTCSVCRHWLYDCRR